MKCCDRENYIHEQCIVMVPSQEYNLPSGQCSILLNFLPSLTSRLHPRDNSAGLLPWHLWPSPRKQDPSSPLLYRKRLINACHIGEPPCCETYKDKTPRMTHIGWKLLHREYQMDFAYSFTCLRVKKGTTCRF